MKYDWNPSKNKSNFLKHGVDFEEAETVFKDENAIVIYDEANSDEEDRFNIVGMSIRIRELLVCHCYRNGDEITRIISARRATKNEIELYRKGM